MHWLKSLFICFGGKAPKTGVVVLGGPIKVAQEHINSLFLASTGCIRKRSTVEQMYAQSNIVIDVDGCIQQFLAGTVANGKDCEPGSGHKSVTTIEVK